DGIRDKLVTGVQTCALPIFKPIMESEKSTNPPSGYFCLLIFFAIIGAAVYAGIMEYTVICVILGVIDILLILPGFIVVNPNESRSEERRVGKVYSCIGLWFE